tara:strand:+ start:145 stop:945 length:801 start_codon:yes stop_codon:yes gene_type:complete
MSLFIVNIVKYYSVYELNKDIKYLFLGTSLSECAFNDKLIDNSKNLAKSNECYYYNYFKVKQILNNDNNNVESIFIDFSNFIIGPKSNELIWNNEGMSSFLPIYLPFLSIQDFKIFINYSNFLDLIKFFSYGVRFNLKKILNFNFGINNTHGGYLKLDRNIKSDINFQLNFEKGLGEINIKYLNRIINLCREKGILVYLVRTPLHPKTKLSNEKELIDLKKTFTGIKFLDYSKFKLSYDQYGDQMHLNYKGAMVFSNWFNYEVKSL